MKTNNDKKMTITTTLHYYYYDISKDDEKQEYLAMCKKLKEIGLIKFDSYTGKASSIWYKDTIKPLNNKNITLETTYLFNNQWNTSSTSDKNGLRVFDWGEAIYPNRSIKEGYYLEQTEEMKYIRDNTFKCGYCWKHYGEYHNPIPDDGLCHACSNELYPPVGDELKLTILKPVSETK